MATDRYSRYAVSLAQAMQHIESSFKIDTGQPQILRTGSGEAVFALNLTPFETRPADVSAIEFFDGVTSVSQLLSAYQSARHSLPFEMDSDIGRAHVSGYAEDFLTAALAKANAGLTREQAVLIADWVKHLDVYCAVKAVESFFYSRADLKLLEIAPRYGWDVIFDHMAIRCGSQAHGDAERVVEMLKTYHGYVATQFSGEAYYQFPDGWNAYPMYKLLRNGQVLRVFVDQSDEEAPAQIIQHWNRVYGYTAHHLAIRATKLENGVRMAVPLEHVMAALEKEGIAIMTPTGHYTKGLLMQVFSRPEKNTAIPEALKTEIAAHDPALAKTIENAKLLELVSRRELDAGSARRFFALYGLSYDANNPLHSAPVYQYFLPAQAAHVINTSQQVA